MSQKFSERFEVDIDIGKAQQRFVNRAYNLIFLDLFYNLNESDKDKIHREIVTSLGDKFYYHKDISEYIGNHFLRNLQALEKFYQVCPIYRKGELAKLIDRLFEESEVDLGVRWENGRFIRSGAKLLDEKLVNDIISWIREKEYSSVKAPFEKGLEHFLHSAKRPELLYDVITDMYEALEAVSQIITERPTKDLSANREIFIAKVKATPEYKRILAEYIDYANEFRHAIGEGRTKPRVTPLEVESFIYLTGLFIRLAMD